MEIPKMIKRKDGFVTRRVGKQIMAVPVGKRTNEIHGMVVLSESGELLWNELENGCEKDRLVAVLIKNYDIDEVTASKDVEEFINMLRDQEVLA